MPNVLTNSETSAIMIWLSEIDRLRGVTQFGRVLGLGPRCRRFKSCHLDHKQVITFRYDLFFCAFRKITRLEVVVIKLKI